MAKETVRKMTKSRSQHSAGFGQSWLGWILVCCFLSLFFLPVSSSKTKADRLTHPPLQQSLTADGYRFTITAADDWQTPAAIGKLYKNERLRWQVRLPHDYGPRFAVVSSAGQVLLVDEFINVASDHALTLFDVHGKAIARYSFEDIQRHLEVSAAELVSHASEGWWVASPPELNAQQSYVQIEAGGKTLKISLSTGELLS